MEGADFILDPRVLAWVTPLALILGPYIKGLLSSESDDDQLQ